MEAVEADHAVAFVEGPAQPGRGADVVSRRQQMTRVETQPQPSVAARRVEQRGQLGEGPTERAAGPGGVLELQRALRAAGESLADHRAGTRDRLADVAGLRRARMKDDTGSPDRVADAEGLDQRRERLLRDLGVLGSAVQQVDGVNEHGLDHALRHRLAKGVEVLRLVRRRPPHPRRLVEDLDRSAATLHATLDRAREAAGLRDMSAD